MYNFIKSLIPASIRERINQRLSKKIDGLLEKRLNELEMLTLKKHVQKLEHEMFMIYPDLLPFTKSENDELDQFLEQHNISKTINRKISKNDLMYQYILLHEVSPEVSLREYYAIGYNGSQLISQLCEHKFGGLKNADAILDFAAGYGRISRFLLTEMEAQNLWVSDIKPNAVSWQKEHFGVNGFNSSFTPEDIQESQKFDLIFVGSLFSHLPDDLFIRWMKKLYEMLSPRGVLAVTVHDQTLSQNEQKSDFEFVKLSEDKTFVAVEDSIKDIDKYGITYVSEKYMRKAFDKVGIPQEKVSRFKLVFGGTQDLYAINKGDNPFDSQFEMKVLP